MTIQLNRGLTMATNQRGMLARTISTRGERLRKSCIALGLLCLLSGLVSAAAWAQSGNSSGGGPGSGQRPCDDCPVDPPPPSNFLPVVQWISPVSGGSYSAPAAITLTAGATDSDGTINRVEFFSNGALLGSDATAPYSIAWGSSGPGSFVFQAAAYDDLGGMATSAPITISVVTSVNTPPAVALSSSNGTVGGVPATFSLVATASDADGGVAKVDFYFDGVLVGSDASSPYNHMQGEVGAGRHAFTAKASDNLGAITTSSPLYVTVGLARSYVYDANERLCKTINPESGATLVDYDAAGNIAWTAEGTALTSLACDRASVTASQKTVRAYDVMNRVRSVTSASHVADLFTDYEIDGVVKTLTVANPGGYNVLTQYSYNRRRKMVSETSTNGSTVFTLRYGFDRNGFLSAITYPDNETVTFSPDALGRTTRVMAASGLVYASNISYHPGGAISSFLYGNQIVHSMAQNLRKLPMRSRDMAGPTAVLDDQYFFDANANVDYVSDATPIGPTNRSKDMGYDGLDRLIVADAPHQWGAATYSYDALDNLKSADQGSRKYRYSYGGLNNRLAMVSSPEGAAYFSMDYDAAGNVTRKGVGLGCASDINSGCAGKASQTFAFDAANRLSQVLNQQVYRYDGQGRRVQTTDVDGKTTFWMYGQSGQVLYTSEARRSQNLSYIYLGNTQVATRTVAWGAGASRVRYQHTDALGSPVVETDELGAVVKRNSYSPYGEAWGPTAIDGTGYTGHVMDQATGLTYMQQRYYDPGIGRFLSVDPVDALDDPILHFSRYQYAYNNPYKFTDPDGRCPMCLVPFIIGALLHSDPANAPAPGEATVRTSPGEALSAALPPGRALVPLKMAVNAGKTHTTYTRDKSDGTKYSGKTSGKGSPEQQVAARTGKSDHQAKTAEGYGPATVDKNSTDSAAIRGREQQLIDSSGGAQSKGGTSGNKINGVSPTNPQRETYQKACNKEFGC